MYVFIYKLLLKSASVRGFFLMNHAKQYKSFLPKLMEMVHQGDLKPHFEMRPSSGTPGGLQGIFDGVDVRSVLRSYYSHIFNSLNGNDLLERLFPSD